MLVSMTGFGQGEASNRFGRVSAEIRSVNHRYLDLAIKMPKALAHREHDVKEVMKGVMRRGRVTVTVTADAEVPQYDVKLNVPLMEDYVDQLQRFGKRKGLGNNLDLNTLAGLPEVFQLQEREQDSDRLWPLIKKALKQAVETCNQMRYSEGKALEVDIRARVTAIGRIVRELDKRAVKATAQQLEAARGRLNKLLGKMQVEEDRWVTEAAIMAERMDFTEELIRLGSHMSQITDSLKAGGAVSKKLTYLLQEVHREATTIASKATDAKIVELVVSLKEESERLREQVQNIE